MGASTGYLTDLRGEWEKLVQHASQVSRSVVEISALSGPELPGLLAFLRTQPRLDFGYVAVHGPTKSVGMDDRALVDVLCELPEVVQSIVLHPDAMTEPEAFQRLGERLVIENMDSRKDEGRFVDELARYFELLPDAGFCLDLAHVSSLDPTMELAHELLDQFGDRLRQIHLSSLGPSLGHVPLTPDDMDRFKSVLDRCRHVPVVLEAPGPDWLWDTP